MGLSRAIGASSIALALLGGATLVARPSVSRPSPSRPAAPRSAGPEVAVAAPSPSPTACGAGVDSTGSVTDASAPGGRRTVWVHRPAGPDRADLPVVYVLHGYPADPAALAMGSLPRLLDAQMCRTGRPFVIAVPDGRSGHLDTEWGDDARGRFAIETFVTQGAVGL